VSGPIPANFLLFLSDMNTAIGSVYLADPLDAEWQQVMTEIPVKTEQYVDAWTGLMPKARPWSGDRVVHQPSAQTYKAAPVPFEITYGMDRFHLDDDHLDVYFRLLPDMVRQTRRQQSYEMRDLLENAGAWTGAAQNGFDGLTYFNTAHPVDFYNTGAGTYCNDFSAGGQNITYTKANGGTVTILTGGGFGVLGFKTLYEYMMTLKGEDLERLGVRPTTLMHPVNLKTEVEVVLRSTSFAPPAWGNITSQVGAADNPFKRFAVTPFMNEYLNDPQMWYLGDTSRGFKPLRWGLREGWRVVARVAETDPNVFDNHMYEWGGWNRCMPLWSYSWLLARSGP
jgi:phage major head subunit gpT-like protein